MNREWVDRLTGQVLDLSTPDGVAGALEALAARVQRVEDATEAVPVGSGSSVLAANWTWRHLGPHGARSLWRDLHDWVGWLRGRYPVAEALPGCWWRHPELVEELTALWLAWRAAFIDAEAGMTAPVEWHDRWLPGTLHRVRRWGVHCEATHRPRPASVYASAAVGDADAFEAMVAEDVAARQAARGKQSLGAPGPAPLDRPAAAGGAGTTTGKSQVISPTLMTSYVATGRAVQLGSLPGSPVQLDGRYWLLVNGGWRPVDDPAVVARLERDQARLAAADDAVRGARGGDPS